MSNSPPALPPPPERQRKRKYSFNRLPGGASGLSENQETIARNLRRRELPPLQAELARITNNRQTRIHNQTKALARNSGWEDLTIEAREAAIEEIRIRSEARYQKDKIKVLKQYEEEVEGEASQTPPTAATAAAPTAQAATTAPTAPTKTRRAKPPTTAPATTTAPTKPPPDKSSITATATATSRPRATIPVTTAPTVPAEHTSHSDSEDDLEFEGIIRDATDGESDSGCEATEDSEGEGLEAEEENEKANGSESGNDSGSDVGEHAKSLQEAAGGLQDTLIRQYLALKDAAKKKKKKYLDRWSGVFFSFLCFSALTILFCFCYPFFSFFLLFLSFFSFFSFVILFYSFP